jgi:hypothetical protein
MKRLFILIVTLAMISFVACTTSTKKVQPVNADSVKVKVDTTKKDTSKSVKVDTTKVRPIPRPTK